MRTLAIDYGQKRTGLALSDAAGRMAFPLEVIEAASPEHVIEPIRRIIDREGVKRIVVGLPLNMDDSVGPATRETIAWARQLSSACGIPAVFVDERLSSFAAEEQLTDRRRAGEKLTRKRKKQQRDAVAAAGFLQEFLDGKLAALEVGE